MAESFIVAVPAEDRTDLLELLEAMAQPAEVVQHRYFDASLYLDALVPIALGTSSWATLRAWILARADAKKATRISINGIEIRGMSAREAERIIRILSEHLKEIQKPDHE